MNIDLHFYTRLLIRRLPVMALLFSLCAGLGVFVALRTPEVYTTSARLLVEEPQIPDSMVSSTVRTGAVEQLEIIQQQLLTRANLIDIANRFDVYEDLRTAEPDTIVARMKSDTRIVRSAGRNQATLMTIRFTGRSGKVVADVVNQYVTLVLEANSEFRMSRAEGTLDFFNREVEQLGAELDEQSVRIATFKAENSNALPEDQSYRLGRQSLLQERMSLLERDLRSSTAQREDIERIFESTGRVTNEQTRRPQSAEEQQLVVAKAELELALSTYSEQNPRVIRLRSVVDRLEAIVSAQTAVFAEQSEDESEITTPEQALFQSTMIEMDNRIETLADEIERTKGELDDLQNAISASSVNGIQLSALTRDFEIIQNRYNNAVNNLNEAQMSERMETTAQGQRITVIEGANVPRVPSGPSESKIIAMASAVGLALAGGFFMLLELLNRSVRRPAELISKFDITPIATIPYMESRVRRNLRRSSLMLATLVAVIGVPLVLYYIDQNYMPMDLLVQKVLARLGIV